MKKDDLNFIVEAIADVIVCVSIFGFLFIGVILA